MNNNCPLISIIIVNYNGKHLLKECFDSLMDMNYPKDRREIFMVDNCSNDGSVQFVQESYPEIKIIGNNINNYCMANNVGIKSSNGEYVAFLNNDTKVDKNWLIELVKIISSDNEIGAVGSKIVFMDGRTQSVGHAEFPNYYWGDNGFLEEDKQQYNRVKKVESISNCAALYRRKVFNEIGFFDEDFEMYMEDVDMAFRLREKKWNILYVPESIVSHHLHGSNINEEEFKFHIEKNRLLFMAKHFPEKLPDLFYGSGEILRLKYSYFQSLLISLLNKLINLYGDKEAAKIFLEVKESVRKIQDFNEHSLRTTLEKRDIQVRAKDQQINDLAARIGNMDEQLSKSQQAQAAQEQHINELTKMIGSKDEQIKNQDGQLRSFQQVIAAKDRQINDLGGRISIQEQHINELTKMIGSKDEQIKNQDGQLRSFQQVISVQDQHINDLTKMIGSKNEQIEGQDVQLRNFQQVVFAKDRQINELAARIANQEEQVNYLNQELKLKGQQILTRDEAIQAMEQEISKIYDSQSYRFIVKPFIWPLFSFFKTMGSSFNMLYSKLRLMNFSLEKTGICISRFYANGIEAVYRGGNEYFVRLINKNYKEKKVRILIDIWPYINRSHPKRHFCYFDTQVLIMPRYSLDIKLNYDWEMEAKFYVNGKESLSDIWRGVMINTELYMVELFVYDLGNHILDRVSILQRLKK